MITMFSLYGITATANQWQIFIFLLTSTVLGDHKFYVTTFKSFKFLLDTLDTYTFKVASIGNEC